MESGGFRRVLRAGLVARADGDFQAAMVDRLANASADVGRVASDLVERAQLRGASRLQLASHLAILRESVGAKRQGRDAAKRRAVTEALSLLRGFLMGEDETQ